MRIGIHGLPHGDLSLLYRARRRTAVLQLSVPQRGPLVLVRLQRSLVFSQGTRKVAPIAVPARQKGHWAETGRKPSNKTKLRKCFGQ